MFRRDLLRRTAVVGLLLMRELQNRPRAVSEPPELQRELRQMVDPELRQLRGTLARQLAHEPQLRAQESELLAVVAAEQGRWLDLKARLDDLERSLPKPLR